MVTLALRVHEARCQNWRAWVLARSCVTARRAGSASHAGTGSSAWSGAMLPRSKASVRGHSVFVPKPLAVREGSVSSASAPPEKTEMMVTDWPSSRRPAMRPPHDKAASSGWGEMKTWVICGRG